MGIFQKIVKAGDLPAEWRAEFPDPESEVEVNIVAVDESALARKKMLEIMDVMSREAKERGLTPEILQDILDDK